MLALAVARPHGTRYEPPEGIDRLIPALAAQVFRYEPETWEYLRLLWFFADVHGFEPVRLPQPRLEKLLDMSPADVRRLLRRLAECGLITLDTSGGCRVVTFKAAA